MQLVFYQRLVQKNTLRFINIGVKPMF